MIYTFTKEGSCYVEPDWSDTSEHIDFVLIPESWMRIK